MDIVRLRRVCEILHETGHLFGLHDGYCYGQTSVGGKCSNQYCYECNGRTVPDCTMVAFPTSVEKAGYCEDCILSVKEFLNNR